MTFLADNNQKNTVLTKSTVLLCKFLDPSNILRHLKAELALNNDDCQKIRQSEVTTERVEKLLETLTRKDRNAYFALMVALRKQRLDLFNKVVSIEWAVTSGKPSESVTRVLLVFYIDSFM